MPNWIRVDAGKIGYYTPFHFDATGIVDCAFTTRTGGTSKAPFDSLNMSLAVSDERNVVLANRRAVAAIFHANPYKIVVPDQVHSDSVRLVTQDDLGAGASDHSTAIPATDALITNTPGVPLVLHFADCVPIFFLDPKKRAIGIAHAGWRGTVAGIVISTVDAMTREFGTNPKNLLAAIGPSIERHCYEVGEDVARAFFKAFPNDERVLKQSSVTKWRVDLKVANLILLQRAGLAETKIAVSERCTSCNNSEFFSYRRDGQTGRMAGWISLRP